MSIKNSKYINDGIPELFEIGINQKDLYSGEGEERDWSVTGLYSPTKATILKERYKNEKTKASKALKAFMGTAFHKQIELGMIQENERLKTEGKPPRFILPERRKLTFNINGKPIVLSMEEDCFDIYEGKLQDIKTTSVWTWCFMSEDDLFNYEAQLNSYLYIMDKLGVVKREDVEKLEILFFFTDYRPSEALRYNNYPNETRTEVLQIKMWTEEETEKYIIERLTELEQNKDLPVTQIKPCTMEDRWQKETTYAIMKKGRKTAVDAKQTSEKQANIMIGVYAKKDAQKKLSKNKTPLSDEQYRALINQERKSYYIEVRESEPKRCIDYCKGANFCDFYLNWQNRNGKTEEVESFSF